MFVFVLHRVCNDPLSYDYNTWQHPLVPVWADTVYMCACVHEYWCAMLGMSINRHVTRSEQGEAH